MKQMIAVRSNTYFVQDEDEKDFKLKAGMELVIIHTNGQEYDIKKGQGLVSTAKLDEIRLFIVPELLQDLITDLQLHQKKLEAMRQNGDQINSLIRHLSENNPKQENQK